MIDRRNATEWVEESFALLRKLVERDNRAQAGSSSKDTKAIYFVISSEFALNGHRDPNDERAVYYDAASPLPITFEDYICDEISKRLHGDEFFRGLRVVFAFSLATYEAIVVPALGGDGFPDRVSHEQARYCTVVGHNKINVLCTGASPALRQVSKFAPAPGPDAWHETLILDSGHPGEGIVRPIFSPKFLWNIFLPPEPLSSSVVQTPPRAEEILVTLPWTDSQDKPIIVAFGICFDVFNDKKHGKCNLAIYVGKTLPLDNVQDTIHPFLACDLESWIAPKANSGRLHPAGYYFNASPAEVGDDVLVSVSGEVKMKETDVRGMMAFSQDILAKYKETPKNWPTLESLYLVERGREEGLVGESQRKYVWSKEYLDLPALVRDHN